MTALEPPIVGFHGSPAVGWFVGFGSDKILNKLDQGRRPIVNGLVANLNRLIDSLLEASDIDEFRRRRGLAMPQLTSLLASLGYLVLADLPKLSELLALAFDQAEELFELSSSISTGEKEEAAFVLAIMRRNVRILMRIAPCEALSTSEAQSLEFALGRHFSAFLDLVLLIECLQRNGPHFVVSEALQGCRAALVAYASLRQFFELRGDGPDPTLSKIAMDEEDRELVESSHRDSESTLSGW